MDELKSEYRRLVRIHHPDIGGDVSTMQEINSQYESEFSRMKNCEYNGNNAGEGTSEEAWEFIKIINALVKIHGITVELCGSWLWISGETMPVKDDLKAAGCRWASKKKMWYWHSQGSAHIGAKRSTSMEKIRSKYGSKVLSQEGKTGNNLCTA